MENNSVWEFQEQLEPIKQEFQKLVDAFGVKNNVSIRVDAGKVWAAIGSDQFPDNRFVAKPRISSESLV